MVHELAALLVLEPVEHREVDDPEELEAIRVEQVLTLRDVQAQLAEQLRGRLVLAGRHDQQIRRTGAGELERAADRLLAGGLERGALHRTLAARAHTRPAAPSCFACSISSSSSLRE